MDIKVTIMASDNAGGRVVTQLDEPVSIEVKEQLKQPTTFTITYPEDICDGGFKMIEQNVFDPFSEIDIWVDINGLSFCLVRGLVQSQQIKLVHGGQGSEVQVSGADNSIRMGWSSETKNWKKSIDAEDIIFMLSTVMKEKKDKKKKKVKTQLRNFAFSKYVILGYSYNVNIPDKIGDDENVKETDLGIALQLEKDQAPPDTAHTTLTFKDAQVQKGDDLSFIRQIAEQKGKYFWVSYDNDGLEIAHFDDLPLKDYDMIDMSTIPILRLNRENNDIDELSISWDADRPTSVISEHIDPRTRQIIPLQIEIAPQAKLGNANLASITSDMINAFQWATVSNETDLKNRSESALNEAEWFIKANCSTSYDRLCKNWDSDDKIRIFHAHEMIYVDGAGIKHSGPYLVSGVTHSISAGSYKVQLQLMRNAWMDYENTESHLVREPVEEETPE